MTLPNEEPVRIIPPTPISRRSSVIVALFSSVLWLYAIFLHLGGWVEIEDTGHESRGGTLLICSFLCAILGLLVNLWGREIK